MVVPTCMEIDMNGEDGERERDKDREREREGEEAKVTVLSRHHHAYHTISRACMQIGSECERVRLMDFYL